MPVSGPMDERSHRQANAMAGNPPDAALLEATLVGPVLDLPAGCVVAAAGASCTLIADGKNHQTPAIVQTTTPARLEMSPFQRGGRVYLAFRGGIATKPVLGSRATDVRSGLGGVAGRALAAGDASGYFRDGLFLITRAGPIWGLAAAGGCFLLYVTTAQPYWAALTHTGAMINLFNLMPVWQLDGDHAFKALNRTERWIATGVTAGMLFVTGEGLLVLVGILAVVQALREAPNAEGDRTALIQFAGLIIALALLMKMPVPGLS